MRKYLGIMLVVEIIAVAFSILGGLIFGVMSYGFIGFLVAVLISLVIVAPVVLMYAVNDLLDRVDVLETKLMKKKVLTKKDLTAPVEEEIWENANAHLQPKTRKGDIVVDNVELCKVCGYQLFDEDTECPNCHTKRK